MRILYIAVLVGVIVGSGCARTKPINVMMLEATCDTIPRPLSPGEQVGGTLPTPVLAVAERGMVLGVVLEAGTGRVLPGSRVRLYRSRSDTGRVQVGKDVSTNTSGAFVLEPQLPAIYTLVVNRIGYSAHTRQVTLQAGVVDTIRIELPYRSCIGY